MKNSFFLITIIACLPQISNTMHSVPLTNSKMRNMLKKAYAHKRNQSLPSLQDKISCSRSSSNDNSIIRADATADASNFLISNFMYVTLEAHLNHEGEIDYVKPLEIIAAPSFQPWVYTAIRACPSLTLGIISGAIGLAIGYGLNSLNQ